MVHAAVKVNQEIAGVDIPVHDAVLVALLDCLQHLIEYLLRLALRQPVLVLAHHQRLPQIHRHQVHHYDCHVLRLEHFIGLHYVRVLQFLNGFQLKSKQDLLSLIHFIPSEYFQCHCLSRGVVNCLENVVVKSPRQYLPMNCVGS